MEKLNQTYTKKELKELSERTPQIMYENGDGKIAIDGMIFKDIEEFKKLNNLWENPTGILKIVKSIIMFFSFIFIRKD